MQKDWSALVTAWKKSNQSIEAFAKANKIPGSTMHYQIKRAKNGVNPYRVGRKKQKANTSGHTSGHTNGHTNGFIDLTAGSSISIEAHGVTIKLPTDIAPEQLRKILEALK